MLWVALVSIANAIQGATAAPVDAGWFTLGGAFVGGTVSLITTLLVLRSNSRIEENRRATEDATRYNLERADAYAEFVALANTVPTLVGIVSEGDFARTMGQMRHAYFKTHLLSPEPMRGEARKIYDFTMNYLNANNEERHRLSERAQKENLTELFIKAAQEELRVSKHRVPREKPPQNGARGQPDPGSKRD